MKEKKQTTKNNKKIKNVAVYMMFLKLRGK